MQANAASRAKAWITRLLLAFVLVSIGFFLGRLAEQRRRGGKLARITANKLFGNDAGSILPQRVRVIFFHPSVRCASCNRIEAMAREALATDFRSELRTGRVVWRRADYQREQDLARHYRVVSTCLVVVQEQDGREVGHRRLDEVWGLYRDRKRFAACLRHAVSHYMRPPPAGASATSGTGKRGEARAP